MTNQPNIHEAWLNERNDPIEPSPDELTWMANLDFCEAVDP